MNATATFFDAGELIARGRRKAARPKVEVIDEDVTGVVGDGREDIFWYGPGTFPSGGQLADAVWYGQEPLQ